MEKIKVNIHDLYSPGWSIDKIKIKYILYLNSDMERLVNSIESDTRVSRRWESNNFLNSKMNFTIDLGSCTVYVGLVDNNLSDFSEAQKTVVVEYNPNKCEALEDIQYLKFLKTLPVQRRKVMYLDLAYDMWCKISDLDVHDRRSDSYHCEIRHNDIETIYFGSLGCNGSARLYDKTKEHNGVRSEEIDKETGEISYVFGDKFYGDLTRYEIRIKPSSNWLAFNVVNPFTIKEFVKLHEIELVVDKDKVLEYVDTFKGTDFVNLFAVFCGYDKKLNNRAKKKYKLMLQEIKEKVINTDKTIVNYLEHYNYDEACYCIRSYLDSIIVNSENEFTIKQLKD